MVNKKRKIVKRGRSPNADRVICLGQILRGQDPIFFRKENVVASEARHHLCNYYRIIFLPTDG